LRQIKKPDVRFGSDIQASQRGVRFTPESGYSRVPAKCPLNAKRGHSPM
jgi:hypothetical protein